MKIIDVVLADDHELVREGLRTIFEEAKDIRIIGEARNGEDAVRLINYIKPHVALLDIRMPFIDGIEATLRIKSESPEVNIIILTSFGESEQVRNAIQAGATGFLLKDVSKEELFRAVRDASTGRPTLHPEAQRKLIEGVKQVETSPLLNSLTARERDVLVLIAKGRSNKEIARDLGLTEGTVKGYISTMFVKIGAADRTQAALFAVRNHLVPR